MKPNLRRKLCLKEKNPTDLARTHLLSSARRAVRASVWNLLSQRYREVLIGLNGSKSMLTFFSFLSSVTIVPQ